MHCQNCGKLNPEPSNFCRHCGARLSVPVQQTLPEQPVAPVFPPPSSYPQPPSQPERRYEDAPPRPYSWKTDEYQVEQPTVVRPPLGIGTPQTGSQNANMTVRGVVSPAANYCCPRCSTTLLPRADRRISTAGWIVFAALLITFFPLFWVGFLIKEDVRTCPVCNLRMK